MKRVNKQDKVRSQRVGDRDVCCHKARHVLSRGCQAGGQSFQSYSRPARRTVLMVKVSFSKLQVKKL